MKKILLISLFMLATLAWAAAQQPGSTPERSSGQATSPSSQAPGAGQSQPSTGGSADQSGGANAPVTEGCLAGKSPNFTITDKAGTTYKLNIPPNANTSKLASHVGEPVQVMGEVKDTKTGNASIDVQGIGSAPGHCPAGSSSGAQSPPKQ